MLCCAMVRYRGGGVGGETEAAGERPWWWMCNWAELRGVCVVGRFGGGGMLQWKERMD